MDISTVKYNTSPLPHEATWGNTLSESVGMVTTRRHTSLSPHTYGGKRFSKKLCAGIHSPFVGTNASVRRRVGRSRPLRAAPKDHPRGEDGAILNRLGGGGGRGGCAF
ncbi:MAG: hypothetical protein Q4E55_07775, partial [Bacteroidales bacterium]|nr:hypothetical protein [Bacteroidales bacterium]